MSTKDDALVEKIARAMCAEMQPNKDPDELGPAPRGTFGLQPFWYRGYERQARAALAVAHKAILEEAKAACEAEHLTEPNPNNECDKAYDRGVRDCVVAIRSLANQEHRND